MAEDWLGGGGGDGAIPKAAGHGIVCGFSAQDVAVYDLVAADVFGS